MAGAGYKLFNTGDVLTAAQVNTYLMQQTIMVFADSSARTTALSGVLAEGMTTYLQDTNSLEFYNGSSWVAAVGDITGVTAGTGLTGGGTSGTVTLTNDMAVTITAKGDLIAGTGNATYDNLAAGSNGDSLVADSAATTGLRWSSTPSASNPVINAAAQIWQRGTSMAGGTSASTGFCADRWQATRGGYAAGQTASRQATGDTTNLPFIQYCIRVQRDSGNTSTATSNLSQSFESSNSIPYAGKTVTLSFYARAGANYSATSNALTYRIDTGTGTDQNVINGYTGGASTLSATATLTTTWQRFQASATLPAATTEIGIVFLQTPTGTAGANDYYEITGVQIDIGSVALPFRTQNSTIQGELAACQRYYQEIGATHPLKANLSTSVYTTIQFNPMRATPTIDLSDAYVISDPGVASYTQSAKNVTIAGGSNARGGMQINMTNFTGLTAGTIYFYNTATVRIQLSAEL